MKWKKQGLIFKPKGNFYWNKSHASVPTPIFIKNGDLRVYYASRDLNNRSYISFIDLDNNNPKKILYEHKLPVLSPGSPGMFDDCGVMPSHAITVDNEIWMYYLGWNIRNTIPYHNSIGLAISSDGGNTFKKFSEGPLFDRNYKEPYYSGMPYVIKDNNLWKMWYLSNTKWIEFNNRKEPYYHIKYAESDNGIDWIRNAKVAIDYKDENECGIVRACVNKTLSKYIMWYSFRNIDSYRENKDNSYRIGYAESTNGIDWERKDSKVGIDRSDNGWDSQMIEYPFVLSIKGKKYMFYNGNKFGESGFGYAISIE